MFIASAEIWQVRRAPPTLSRTKRTKQIAPSPSQRTMNHRLLVGRAHVTREHRVYVCMYVYNYAIRYMLYGIHAIQIYKMDF